MTDEQKDIKTFHVGLNIRSAIKDFSKRELGKLLVDEHGKNLTAEEAKDALLDMLAEGNEMLPLGDCDNFDRKEKGCLGH